MQFRFAGALIAGAVLSLSATAAFSQSGSPTIDAIVKRGQLVCGVAGNTAGLSLPDSQGVMRGLDADHCRTVAAAISATPRR